MLNTESLMKLTKGSDSWSNGDFHQFILDVMYGKWNDIDTEKHRFSYEEMVDWMKVEYGPAAALFVMLGKYNQQVENGGHGQYLFNRYSGTKNRLHKQMIEGMEKTGLSKCDLGKEVYRIMKSFIHTPTMDEETNDPFDSLDQSYYDLHGWMPFLNNYVREWLTTGANPLAKLLVADGSVA